jgi:calcium-dependent protein kinase
MFLVMEYYSGGDLYSRPLPYDEPLAARVITKILSAVAHCHKQKIVHRDLKLENVLFESHDDPEAEVRVIDFGYAQHYSRPRGDYTMKIDIGTTYTMSPQVIQGQYTEKCDLWSVGVITYILLSGKRPFDAESDNEVRAKILEGKYSMEGFEWDNVSTDAKEFIAALLEYYPEKRLSTEEALESPWLQSALFCEGGSKPLVKEELSEIEDALVHSVDEPRLKRLSMMVIAHLAPAEKLNELRQAFDLLDSSHDGTITLAEFLSTLRGYDIPDADAEEIFRDLDQNDTGVINYTEFLSATLETQGRIDEELVAEAFEKLDVENTGTINKDGLTSIFEATDAIGDSEEVAQEILKESDAGSDGKFYWLS